MEKRSKTPDPSLGELLWTAWQWGEERGREHSTGCKTLPLAATQEFLWEPKVLLACVVLKQTLSMPQKIRSALIICTHRWEQLHPWLLWFLPALLPRFIPASSQVSSWLQQRCWTRLVLVYTCSKFTFSPASAAPVADTCCQQSVISFFRTSLHCPEAQKGP